MRFLLLSLTILACWAAEAPKLPADVQTVLDKATVAETAAQSEADARILKIKQALVKDLTKLQETYTKKGNLDAANGIKSEIDGIKLPDLIDTRPRVDPARFKNYTAKVWDSFPGDTITVSAEASPTVATLDKSQEAILLPHPGDLWASHDQGKKADYHGLPTQHRGLAHMIMLVKVGDADVQVIDTARAYAGPGAITVSANDDNPSNNTGSIRMKVIIQKKP